MGAVVINMGGRCIDMIRCLYWNMRRGYVDITRDNRLLTYQEAAQYCGLTEGYFRNQHKERQGPEFVKPSPRRVFFTPRALDRWMANWKVVAR